jgi:adenylosuccinate lyase
VVVGELGGAVGTLAALGRRGLLVQARLMRRLGLGVPNVPTKTAGDRFAEFFLLLCLLSATIGKIAQNIYNLQQSEVDEVSEFVDGKIGSSAMPHKLNPVASGSVVLLGRLLRARAAAVLDYVHAEGEDDHRQGETIWSFAPEICLLLGAQLVLAKRLLGSLIVKPANMRRNLDRAGGVVLSEAVMMALARKLGRDKAHALVLAISRDALVRGVPFREAVAGHPEVQRHLSAGKIASALDYGRSLGLAGLFVDRVVAAHQAEKRPRGAAKSARGVTRKTGQKRRKRRRRPKGRSSGRR